MTILPFIGDYQCSRGTEIVQLHALCVAINASRGARIPQQEHSGTPRSLVARLMKSATLAPLPDGWTYGG
jgi:hypothetical protein